MVHGSPFFRVVRVDEVFVDGSSGCRNDSIGGGRRELRENSRSLGVISGVVGFVGAVYRARLIRWQHEDLCDGIQGDLIPGIRTDVESRI